MTKSDLIEKLKPYPDDIEIVMPCVKWGDTEIEPVASVELINGVYIDENYKYGRTAIRLDVK